MSVRDSESVLARDIVKEAQAEYRALRFMSYTGERPDMTQEGVDRIADLISDLAIEILILRVPLTTPSEQNLQTESESRSFAPPCKGESA